MLSAAIDHAATDTRRLNELVADEARQDRDHHPGGRQVGGDADQVKAARHRRRPHAGVDREQQHDASAMMPRLSTTMRRRKPQVEAASPCRQRDDIDTPAMSAAKPQPSERREHNER